MRWPHTCMLVGAIVLGCAAFAPELAGARPERRDAPERAHRTGRRSHAEHPEALLQAYKQFYVLPRAYPDSLIDPSARPRAFRQLQAMRDTLHIPYAPPPGLLAPIGVRTQPCAWRSIGPTNVNGRVTGIAIDPTNRDHMWVTTMGGIWRSLDRGRSWQCVSYEAGPGSTCDLQSGAFGAVAVNPANTSEVFAGGGDPNYTAYAGGGPGLWRSVADGDANTWKCEPVGFASTAVVRRIRVGPASQNDVYVATSAGIWKGTRSATGTLTWSNLGGFTKNCSDLVVDFSQTPAVVYAGVVAPPADKGIHRFSGGAWQRVWDGTGTASWKSGAIALALAASNPQTLYAKVENDVDGTLKGIYVTTNAGGSWTRRLSSDVVDDSFYYTGYNCVIEVDPTDAERVYVGGLQVWRATRGGLTPSPGTPAWTENGGQAWKRISYNSDQAHYYNPNKIHHDQHCIAIDPVDPHTLWVGNDGGLDFAENTNTNTYNWVDRGHGLVITQFFAIASQRGTLTAVACGSQDNGAEVTFGNQTWYANPNCDAASVALDAPKSSALYQGCNDQVLDMTNPVAGSADGLKGRPWSNSSKWPWPPVASDRFELGSALASQGYDPSQPPSPLPPPALLKLTDASPFTWITASPPMTGYTQIACVAIGDACTGSTSHFCSYYVGAVDTFKTYPPTIWSTNDGGVSWIQTPNGIPTNRIPNAIAVDPDDPTRAFAGFGGNSGGEVRITTDHGRNWSPLTVATGCAVSTIPQTPVTGVVLDPGNRNVIYVTTAGGIFRGEVPVGGTTVCWRPFDEGLPNGVDISDITANSESMKLVISTMGYGAWERDIRLSAACPEVLLTIRDNVFDTGIGDSPDGLPDPEHPVVDPSRPAGYFQQSPDLVHWFTSPDIRIEVPGRTPVQNRISDVDPVSMESCPVEATLCPPGTLNCPDCPNGTIFDQDPHAGEDAVVYVQVTNRGTKPAHDLKVFAMYADATAGLPLVAQDFWSAMLPPAGTNCAAPTMPSAWTLLPGDSPTDWCKHIHSLEPGEATVVAIDWHVPITAAEHSCMLAMVDSPDDPIDRTLGANGVLRPDDFVQPNHQIGLRNLHVVDGIAFARMVRGSEALKITNPTADTTAIDLEFYGAGMRASSRVDVLLPPLATPPDLRHVHVVGAPLDSAQRALADSLGVDRTQRYRMLGRSAAIRQLHIPPGATWSIELIYDTGPGGRPNTASRFTLLTRRGSKILGGSTYVLRIR